ncbi:MAG: bifunctional DNA-formamidopyrimidine glycosylase/DNA-(apurinic or apyrimidinic site) lyase [Alphaproteobacteria bacterium]|jgi:formamidopyrimidine-DNA glycosylase|nr:bifunctional DNA-formamidopyrimidine glycosylase/DNA-(apurinic or apyrimidinic site) lyase [Alphaproteobacteria bacterium]
MPELPEVETVRAGLASKLVGKTIDTVLVRRTDLRIPIPPKLAERLKGRRLDTMTRRGKYLLWNFDDGLALLSHLGMSGQMVLGAGPPPPPQAHDHVHMAFTSGDWVRYRDPRRFGLMDLTTIDQAPDHPLLATMGPEPLSNGFNGPVLAAALVGRGSTIKAALLDQKIVAGIGNIYASEALYCAGISPRRKAGSVGPVRAERLVAAITGTLNDAIASGGSSLKDYVQATGDLGYFQHQFAVYGREGVACPQCDPNNTCRVRHITQSGRSTYYCPTRQR